MEIMAPPSSLGRVRLLVLDECLGLFIARVEFASDRDNPVAAHLDRGYYDKAIYSRRSRSVVLMFDTGARSVAPNVSNIHSSVLRMSRFSALDFLSNSLCADARCFAA